MRIAIMGSGGVGGYFGGRLAASGQDVTFVARGAHLDAVRQRGLAITSALGDATIRPAKATDDPAQIGPVDLVVFAVKLYDSEGAAEAIRPLVGQGTGVVTLQNGVDSTDLLSRAFGPEHVIGGVANIAAVIAEPGIIRHTGTMARVVFGELNGRTSERVAALAQALHGAGVDHRLSDDIRRDIWDKMVLLSAFSGLTALMRLPIGPILEEPDTRAMYREGLAEALAVGRAKGTALPDDLTEQKLAQTGALPYEMRSSMLEDLERGRRLELPWLSGAIARMGQELGIATPVHSFVTTALKLHAAGTRSG
jgi:2-dehydropantoate 2-reductase